MPRLTALFFGDIIVEESEISWIEQTDVSPLLAAFPQLEIFGVRGGNGLSFGQLRHDVLQTLIVETGGLSGVGGARGCGGGIARALRHLANCGWGRRTNTARMRRSTISRRF
ncbi:MAG: hypothetical protein U0841_09645 [Chloroflexia bacterium]